MTFAALLVTQKYDKGKVSLCFFAGRRGADPYKIKPKVPSTAKGKIKSPFAFSFAKSGAKEKAIKKKTPKEAFALCGARPTPPSARAAFPKMRAKTLMGWRKLYYGEKNY